MEVTKVSNHLIIIYNIKKSVKCVSNSVSSDVNKYRYIYIIKNKKILKSSSTKIWEVIYMHRLKRSDSFTLIIFIFLYI